MIGRRKTPPPPPVPSREKCDRELGWCADLESRLEEPNANTKGLVPIRVLKRGAPPGSGRVIGVAFKRSGKDRGLMLDFCPFCGVSIEVLPSEVAQAPRPEAEA